MPWKEYLKDSILNIDELSQILTITEDEKLALKEIEERHPMRITQYYFDLIDWQDPHDPIRKLSVPSLSELDASGDYDTSGEASNTKMPGIQHKYKTTALVLSTNVCYMYCRHCFRKRMVGYSTEETLTRMEESIEYIKEHKEINNILISGGDSFALENSVIEKYLKNLSEIDHLDFIRFGTRIPVVFPPRIYMDEELLAILKNYQSKKEIIVITQFNHPKEITEEAKKGIEALKNIGIPIKNQAVLLKGVNDQPHVMAQLMNGLTAIGIQPYYLFQCRPVKYVKEHFQVPFYEGIEIIAEAKKKMNGLGKGFKFAMSHPLGKIEIIGKTETDFIFKFQQNKYEEDSDRLFFVKIDETAAWLDDELKSMS